jgi:hypothetical protein
MASAPMTTVVHCSFSICSVTRQSTRGFIALSRGIFLSQKLDIDATVKLLYMLRERA